MNTKRLESSERDHRRFYHLAPRNLRRKIRRSYLKLKHFQDRANVLPDFCILGGMKCGTTALFMYLEMHPHVWSGGTKEIHYFNTNRDFDESYYRSFFPEIHRLCECDNVYQRQIVGEATPDYLFHPAAPKLFHDVNPNAKLIILMRNPIDRAYSHWKQGHRFGFETETFERAIALEPDRLRGEERRMLENIHYYSYRHQMYSYLERGKYLQQIERWQEHFSNSQFLYIYSEDLFSQTSKEYKKVLEFLELPEWTPESFDIKFPGVSGTISSEARQSLQEYFEPYNGQLKGHLGKIPDWQ